MPTTKRYEIRTVRDFALVPAEKIPAMMQDFEMFLRLHAEVEALGLNAVTQTRDVFKWLDDNLHDAHVTLTIKQETGKAR